MIPCIPVFPGGEKYKATQALMALLSGNVSEPDDASALIAAGDHYRPLPVIEFSIPVHNWDFFDDFESAEREMRARRMVLPCKKARVFETSEGE